MSSTESLPGRRFLRKPVYAKARLFFGDQVLTTDAIEISEGGLRIQTDRSFEQGEEMHLHITVLRTYIRARVTVCYSNERRDHAHGPYSIGMKFTSIDEIHRHAIKEYVDLLCSVNR